MFSGIVQGRGVVNSVAARDGYTCYEVAMPAPLMQNIAIGASVAIEGVCLTVVSIAANRSLLSFDAIGETIKRTTLGELTQGDEVNVERSVKVGDEIGGHLTSGHIWGCVDIVRIEKLGENKVFWLRCPATWCRYLLPKGYVAINGASLTLVDVDDDEGLFSVHLIPETLRITTFGRKTVGSRLNLEIDAQTQAIVDTVDRFMQKNEHRTIAR